MVDDGRRATGWWLTVVAGMASYIDSAAITGFSTSMVIYQHSIGLDATTIGVAAGTLTAAIAVGALIGGRLGDRVGRRPVFIATMVMIIVAATMLSVATSPPLMIFAAALLGLGVGADLPVSLSTISESAPDDSRGKRIAFSNLLWVAGIIANAVLTSLVGDLGRVGAQIIFCHIAFVALLVLAARLTVPESSFWRAARSARATRRHLDRHGGGRIRELFRPPMAAPLLALLVFYGLTNLVANTSGQFGTYVLVNFGGASVATASRVSLITAPLVIVGLLLFMRIVDTPARLTYFVVGAICGVVSPLLLGVFGVSMTTYLLSAILGAVGIAFAFEAIMKVWAQESFPTLLRATAQGAIIGAARFAAAMLAAVTPLLLQAGTAAFYFTLSALELAGVVTAWLVFRRRVGESEFDAPRSDEQGSPRPAGPGARASAD